MSASSTSEKRETVVVGAGPGGYVAAIRAAQRGQSVTLVDKAGFGGTCLNHGCIPSKALLTATGRVQTIAEGTHMGIYADPYIDFAAMQAWKNGVVDTLTDGVASLVRARDIDFIEGQAQFADETTLHVDTGNDDFELGFETAVLATGSRPVELDGLAFDGSRILSSRDALSMSEVPDRLLVVGAGYIGLELATVFANLGSDVTVVEALGEALPAFDTSLTDPVCRTLESRGVDFLFDRAAVGWRGTLDGIEVLVETGPGSVERHGCDAALVAVGREPLTDGLGLEAGGVRTVDGAIDTDAEMRTSNERVFAIGDVAGDPMLAHAASHEAERAVAAATGTTVARTEAAVPAVVYTDPEIATVGHSRASATESGYDPAVGEFDFAANGRALTSDADQGFCRLVADEQTGRLLGADIVGAEASELVGGLVRAIDDGARVADLAGSIQPHPTLSEAIAEAAAGASGRAVHSPD